jgi:pimeloyl-ACP methyl ester carboxylesterase
MREVLMLHEVGIFGGRGPWQRSVGRVLDPHFKCISIQYSHYRWLGFLTAVVEPRLFLPGLASLLVLRWTKVVPVLWPWLIVLFLSSVLAARVRHRWCLQDFLSKSYRSTALGGRPHLIAHSMGTKIVGSGLDKYPDTGFGNIILAGCVLPTDYPWHRIKSLDASRFVSVRNEVGRRDFVPRLAHFAAKSGLLSGFGPSGTIGFDEVVGFIHTTVAAASACAECIIGPPVAVIHNVISDQFGHSSVFDSPGYVACFWLPFLWGIEPADYSSFLRHCLDAEEHFEAGNWLQNRRAEDELLDSHWEWAGNITLRKYIAEVSECHPAWRKGNVPATGQIVRKVWQDFAIACHAHQERTAGWKDRIAALNPRVAVVRAVDAILG